MNQDETAWAILTHPYFSYSFQVNMDPSKLGTKANQMKYAFSFVLIAFTAPALADVQPRPGQLIIEKEALSGYLSNAVAKQNDAISSLSSKLSFDEANRLICKLPALEQSDKAKRKSIQDAVLASVGKKFEDTMFVGVGLPLQVRSEIIKGAEAGTLLCRRNQADRFLDEDFAFLKGQAIRIGVLADYLFRLDQMIFEAAIAHTE